MGSHDLVDAEWEKIQSYFLQHGAIGGAKIVIEGIRDNLTPIALCLRSLEHLLAKGEFTAAGSIIGELRTRRVENPLIDEIRSSWMWCIGEKEAALAFAFESAKKWNRSYLYKQLAVLCGLAGDLAKEQKFSKKASKLALIEDRDSKEQGRGTDRPVRGTD